MADVQVKVGEVSLRVEKLSLFCCLFNVEEGRVNFNSFSCFAIIFFLCCSWNVLITNVNITEHAKPISQHQLELLACCHRWKKKKKKLTGKNTSAENVMKFFLQSFVLLMELSWRHLSIKFCVLSIVLLNEGIFLFFTSIFCITEEKNLYFLKTKNW